jgi:hypothetical protein
MDISQRAAHLYGCQLTIWSRHRIVKRSEFDRRPLTTDRWLMTRIQASVYQSAMRRQAAVSGQRAAVIM